MFAITWPKTNRIDATKAWVGMSEKIEEMGSSPAAALKGIAILCGINMVLCFGAGGLGIE